jgi:tRNA-specific 2-thiouridylase
MPDMQSKKKESVYIGMSGGVDSSVSALLLSQDNNYSVKGRFMKNWSKDLPGFRCPWQEDWRDAQTVALQLAIPIELLDFEDQYFQKVVQYMLDGYNSGLTPNPDIICNQEIKFKLFLNTALEQGADKIATGHYARIHKDEQGTFWLKRAKDINKDQTYFLYRITEEALSKSLFPLGDLLKPKVRQIAKKHGLTTANKKDSVGVCFVGDVGIVDFLKSYLTLKEGDIIEIESNKVVGRHQGSQLYTIGQRHGLNIGGGLPYYVSSKDVSKNIIFVSKDLNNPDILKDQFSITNVHFISESAKRFALDNKGLKVQIRYRSESLDIDDFSISKEDQYLVKLKQKARSIAPGQSAVIYSDDLCLGGGIIC